MDLVVSQTAEGPRCIAPGVCAVCGWRGWEQWDIGLKPIPTEPNSWIADADPVCTCPNCTLSEVDVYPGAAHDSLHTLPGAAHDSLHTLPACRERGDDDRDGDEL